MEINWTIDWLKTTPTTANPPEYVIECGWRCIGTDGAFSGAVYSTCSFAVEPDENGNFTPYNELTEAQVLSWCWGSGVPKGATEAAVAAQIEAQKNPPYIQPPLPWNQTTTKD
jgi:hypothetical protein